MNTIKYMIIMAAICGISYGFTNSVYSGTYFDASTTNTTSVSGSTWYSTSGSSGTLWALRAFENSSTVFEADGMVSGTGDAPMIKTTMSGLYPYMYYNTYVVYWSASGVYWCLWAGLTSDSLTLYSSTTSSPTGATGGTATGATDGNRSEYEAHIGITTANSSGDITIYIDDSTLNSVNNRAWYDGLEYEVINVPYNPTPADDAVSVAVTTTALSFSSMRDPNDMTVENPKIVSHKVYFDDDPNLADTSDLVATLSKGSNQATIAGLDYDKTYYWRVDDILQDGTVVAGYVWTFESAKTTPDFDPPIGTQPEDTAVMLGDNAVLTVSAGVGTYTYQWYKGDSGVTTDPVSDEEGHISGAATNEMTITTQAGDEGTYWCRASNSETDDSDAATVVVKRKVAHWTLNDDAQGWDGTSYLDSSGEGHDAAADGTPTFVDGVDGTGSGAVIVDTDNGYASVDTWNPSEYSGQFTMSMWVKWSGQNDPTTWQGLFSKEESYGDGSMMWQLEVESSSASSVILKNGLETNNLTSDILPIGTWEHIAVTFDGTTATIYRNGAAAVSGAWTMGTGTETPVNIGISARSTTEDLMFNGQIDDVQVYNYALDAYAMAEIYTDIVPSSICIENPDMDFSGPDGEADCKVNLYDFAVIADKWMECNLVPTLSCYN